MIDLNTISDGIASALVPTELTIYPRPTGSYVTDSIIVYPGSPFIGYYRTFGTRGIAELNFTIEVHVGAANDIDNAFQRMYRLLGSGNDSTSIFDLLGADATLGGVVHQSIAREVSGPRLEVGDDGLVEVVASFGLTVHERRGTSA